MVNFRRAFDLAKSEAQVRTHVHVVDPNVRLSGLETFRKFEDILENGFEGVRRYEFQRKLEEKYLRHLSPQLLGRDWLYEGVELMHQRNWPSVKKGVVSLCPRQTGKSWIVAHLIAAMALLQATTITDSTEYRIVVISANQRAAIVVLDYVRDFLSKTTVRGWKKVMDNVDVGIALKGVGGRALIRVLPKADKVRCKSPFSTFAGPVPPALSSGPLGGRLPIRSPRCPLPQFSRCSPWSSAPKWRTISCSRFRREAPLRTGELKRARRRPRRAQGTVRPPTATRTRAARAPLPASAPLGLGHLVAMARSCV